MTEAQRRADVLSTRSESVDCGRIHAFYDIDGKETTNPTLAIVAVVRLTEGKWATAQVHAGDFPSQRQVAHRNPSAHQVRNNVLKDSVGAELSNIDKSDFATVAHLEPTQGPGFLRPGWIECDHQYWSL